MSRAFLPVVAATAALIAPSVAGSRTSSPDPCPAADLALSLHVARSAAGASVATATLAHTGDATCRLQATLTIGLLSAGPDSKLLAVKGNPARVKLGVPITGPARLSLSWTWRNWCAGRGAAVVNASTDVGAARSAKIRPPACTAKTRPSTLRRNLS